MMNHSARHLLVTIALILASLAATAQTVTMTMGEFEVYKNRIDSLKDVTKTLTASRDSLNAVIANQNKIIAALGSQTADLRKASAADSAAIATLTDSIASMAATIARTDSAAAAMDDIRFRYIASQLLLPYSKKAADRAIAMAADITDPAIRKKVDIATGWIRQSPKYYRSTRDLLQRLQDDPARTDDTGLFTPWKKSALDAINACEYVKASKGDTYSIYYLDSILDTARKRLAGAQEEPFTEVARKGPKHIYAYTVDFSDLITLLTLPD